MTRIERLNYHQDKALEAWVDAGFRGTAMLFPGAGKTILAFKAAYKLLELGKIAVGDTILFLAETTVREKTILEDEAPKFKALYGKDILADFDFQFRCYQAIPINEFNSESLALVIADELQDTLSAKYSENIINNKCKHTLGLTGAMSLEQHVYPQAIQESASVLKIYQTDEETKKRKVTAFISKGQMLDIFLPVCYKVTTEQAIEEGMISRYKTTIINHHLDNSLLYKKPWKKSVVESTELDYYNVKDKRRSNFSVPNYIKKTIGLDLANMLWNLPSKIVTLKKMMDAIDGQTLIFTERLEILEGVCPVVRPENADKLIDQFNRGDIQFMASSKMLKQGITLKNIRNIIFFSYTSKWHNMEQKRARIRYIEGQQANLYFIVTTGTLEEKWFSKLKQEFGATGKLIKEHSLNVDRVIDSRLTTFDL